MEAEGNRTDGGLFAVGPNHKQITGLEGVTAAIVRYQNVFFVLIALMCVAAFNGRWRVNPDTALYRGIAHNLATGHGYTFAHQTERWAYPGLPLMLAGLEKLFGTSPLWPILLMHLMTAGCI